MYKPSMYSNFNSVPRQDAYECLLKYGNKLKWGKNDTIADLGSGDGSVTVEILKQFIPSTFKHLIGCDISLPMVSHANQTYGDARTSFVVQDVGGVLQDSLVGAFNHVFSSYALHWIQDQERVFQNIHNMLLVGGDCLLLIVSKTYVFDCYRILARKPRWQHCMRHVERYISPYQDLEDPEKQARDLMLQVGFRDVFVKQEKKIFVYEEEYFKNTMESIAPFDIPSDLRDQYKEDFLQAARELKAVEEIDGKTFMNMCYSVLTICGTK